MARIPFEIKPGDGCWGQYHSGRILGLCSTQCARMGGKELAPAATVVKGHAACVNILPMQPGRLNASAVQGEGSAVHHAVDSGQAGAAEHPARVGGPKEGAACGGVQSGAPGVCS